MVKVTEAAAAALAKTQGGPSQLSIQSFMSYSGKRGRRKALRRGGGRKPASSSEGPVATWQVAGGEDDEDSDCPAGLYFIVSVVADFFLGALRLHPWCCTPQRGLRQMQTPGRKAAHAAGASRVSVKVVDTHMN